MIKFTFQMPIQAPAQALWDMYADFSKRKQWETDLEYIKLDRNFSTGATGVMKLANQPEMPYTITSAIPCREYWDRTEIPGTGLAICFGHDFAPQGNSTVLLVSVKLEKSAGQLTDEDVSLLAHIFSDTPQSVLAIRKLVEK